MAVKGYTTEAKIEDYILQNIDPTFSTRISEWIEGIELFIDKVTGRNFKADSAASARLYDGDESQTLLIDDCVAITKVEVGEDSYGSSFTEILATGSDRYFTYPENAALKGVPFYKLILNGRRWPDGMQNNRITAKWGYSTTPPADIIFAATVLVAGVLNQHRGGGDKIVQERIGNYTVSYDSDEANSLADFRRTMEILDSYKKLRI